MGARPVAEPSDAARGATGSRGNADQGVETAPHPPDRYRDAARSAAGRGHQADAGRGRSRRHACTARRRTPRPGQPPARARAPRARRVHQLAEAAPTDDPNASTEDEPSSTKPPDAAILLSLPGIGNKVLATLLAEGNDAVRGDGTTTHFAVSAGWLQSPAVRVRACS